MTYGGKKITFDIKNIGASLLCLFCYGLLKRGSIEVVWQVKSTYSRTKAVYQTAFQISLCRNIA